MKIKDAGKAGVKFLAAGAGVAGSAFGLKQVDKLIPASVPALAKKLAPGLATILIGYIISTKVSNDNLKALSLGIGAGGALDILRKTLGDKIAFINDNIPALSGPQAYRPVNTGGVGYDYYLYNSLQGLGNPYALNGQMSMQGVSMQGTSMQGPGGAMSAANSYALGNPYALN